MPSSSIVIEPRLSVIVPSSRTVTPGDATLSPSNPANAEVSLRLKSPSRPWPTASCSRIPGHPGPRATSITPAGAFSASRLTSAIRSASRAAAFHSPSEMIPASSNLPPLAFDPVSRRPFSSTMTETRICDIGRASAIETPSARRISISCMDAEIVAVACTTRLSRPRMYASISFSSRIFRGKSISSTGSLLE